MKFSMGAGLLHAILCVLAMMLPIAEGFSQNLKSGSNRADYIAIASSRYAGLAEQLALFRQQQNGYATMVVSLDSVVAQFTGRSTPDSALRDFIQYALHSWQDPKPQYVVLVGNRNAVPAHVEAEDPELSQVGHYDSLCIDHWYVEEFPPQHGYGRAQAALGRLPAWDSTGLANMIGKVIEYERATPAAWCNTSIALADYDTLTFDFFESQSQNLQYILSSVWTDTVTVSMNGTSAHHLEPVDFRKRWDQGAAIVTYCGHANPYTLSATKYFTSSTVDSLTNDHRLPVCFFGGCDLRFDAGPPSSIPAHLLEQPSTGAVACVASAGVMYADVIVTTYRLLFDDLVHNPARSVGKAFMDAKNANPGGITRRITFLGDPAMRIKRPTVTEVASQPRRMAADLTLYQNYPNPFHATTTIRYAIPRASYVTMAIFSMLGQQVSLLVNSEQSAGTHEVSFHGAHLAGGTYILRVFSGSSSETMKLILKK
jgi:hypothetical protein